MNKADNANTKQENPALLIERSIEDWKNVYKDWENIYKERNIQVYPINQKYTVHINPNGLDGRPLSAKELKNKDRMYAFFEKVGLW